MACLPVAETPFAVERQHAALTALRPPVSRGAGFGGHSLRSKPPTAFAARRRQVGRHRPPRLIGRSLRIPEFSPEQGANEPSDVAPDARLNPEAEVAGAADRNEAKHRSVAWSTFHQTCGQAGHIEGEPDVQQPGGDYATHPENADDEK